MPQSYAQVQVDSPLTRPRILVSYSPNGPEHPDWLTKTLTRYAQNVERELQTQGASPEFFYAGSTPSQDKDLSAILSRFDGLLILGGGDISPVLYGMSPTGEPIYGVDRGADEAELALVRHAARSGLPILGICRGLQIINVAFGGNLVQDLGPNSIHQLHTEVPGMTDHEVSIQPGSKLSQALGANNASVRSGHHQAVHDLGKGLTTVAEALDGVIEAVEHEQQWILGVQWHPEDPATVPGQFAALIRAYTMQCSLTRVPGAPANGCHVSAESAVP